jgi:predicted dehydrogenase
VCALLEFDENFGTDILSSVIMQFPSSQAVFSVSTQIVPYQRMHFLGQEKELEIKIPFNAPNDRPCEININPGDIHQENVEKIFFDKCDQYAVQAEAFSKAITENTEVPVPLEDALANTKALEAIYKSASEERWVALSELQG